LAAVADGATAVLVRSHQADYPLRFAVFQTAMFVAALLVAVPRRWVGLVGLILLVAGVVISWASVGVFYIPAVVAAGWLTLRP